MVPSLTGDKTQRPRIGSRAPSSSSLDPLHFIPFHDGCCAHTWLVPLPRTFVRPSILIATILKQISAEVMLT